MIILVIPGIIKFHDGKTYCGFPLLAVAYFLSSFKQNTLLNLRNFIMFLIILSPPFSVFTLPLILVRY